MEKSQCEFVLYLSLLSYVELNFHIVSAQLDESSKDDCFRVDGAEFLLLVKVALSNREVSRLESIAGAERQVMRFSSS